MAATICSLAANAQDVIVRNDGSTITSKVLEVSSTEIKYKKFSNPTGPTYSISKTDVNYINYENGDREDFGKAVAAQTTETSNTQFSFAQQQNNRPVSDVDLLRNYNRSYKKRAKTLKLTGLIGAGVCLAAGAYAILFLTPEDNGDSSTIAGCSIIGFGAVWGSAFYLAGMHQSRKANSYANTSTPLMQFNLTTTKNSSVYANIDTLNDNINNKKALGVGMQFNF